MTSWPPKGVAHEKGVDYFEIFALVPTHSAILSFIGLAAHHGWKVTNVDAKSGFFNAKLEKQIYFTEPQEFGE